VIDGPIFGVIVRVPVIWHQHLQSMARRSGAPNVATCGVRVLATASPGGFAKTILLKTCGKIFPQFLASGSMINAGSLRLQSGTLRSFNDVGAFRSISSRLEAAHAGGRLVQTRR
jgi:hypothetical protein